MDRRDVRYVVLPSRSGADATGTAASYATFDEANKGRIAPGLLADLTLIDRDLRAIPAPEIRDATVVRTIVGGKTVFPR